MFFNRGGEVSRAHDNLLQEELNLMPVHVYGMTGLCLLTLPLGVVDLRLLDGTDSQSARAVRRVMSFAETYGPITKCYQLPEWEALPKDERYAKMARQGHGFISSLPIRVVKTDGREGEGLLVDVAKDGKEVGEIVMFGNLCARGYYKDADASSKLFAGGGLHSGDLAVWHADGSAQIVDRSKDVIISGGENISSVAIEKALGRHPDILEAGVVAVADELWGERPRAYVTVRSGARVRGPDIVSWVKKEGSIGGFMVPREVVVVSELPKTSTGKIKKNELRAWARGGAPGGEGGDGEMG